MISILEWGTYVFLVVLNEITLSEWKFSVQMIQSQELNQPLSTIPAIWNTVLLGMFSCPFENKDTIFQI